MKTRSFNLAAICPRCDHHPLAVDLAQNALSRHQDDTYVCSPCGEDEAVLDFARIGGIEPWPIARQLMSFTELERFTVDLNHGATSG